MPRGQARIGALRVLAAALACTLLPTLAHAHTGSIGGFGAGFLHPLGGIDHVLAMLAVGIWGAQLGPPALWVLPVAFPMVMAVGGVAGILGIPVPWVELGIAMSVIVLGSMIALDQRPPLWIAALLVAFFAIFHGYAHGLELPGQAGAVEYSAGFVLSTGLIHLTGILIGFVIKFPSGLHILRAGGTVIVIIGIYLAASLLLA